MPVLTWGQRGLAKRYGLLNTMVFTHLPSSVLLIAVPLAPSFKVAILLFLLREALAEMDVPTRQPYVAAVVRPEERTFGGGLKIGYDILLYRSFRRLKPPEEQKSDAEQFATSEVRKETSLNLHRKETRSLTKGAFPGSGNSGTAPQHCVFSLPHHKLIARAAAHPQLFSTLGFQQSNDGVSATPQRGPLRLPMSGCDGNDPQGASGAAYDFEWCSHDDGTSRRKLIKVGQPGQPKLAVAVHKVVVGEGWVKGSGLAGIGPDRLHADP